MKEIIDVDTGYVKLDRGKVVLRSLAVGSCIAVAAYDCQARIGAMAHIVLPGSAPEDSSAERTEKAFFLTLKAETFHIRNEMCERNYCGNRQQSEFNKV